MPEYRYIIKGMDCAEEVRALRETVGSLNGIENLDFNLLNGTMKATCSPGLIGEQEILAGIKKAGLDAQPVTEGSPDKADADVPTFWMKHGREIMCISSGALIALGFVCHWLAHGSFMDAFFIGEGNEHHRLPFISILMYVGSVVTGSWYVFPKALKSIRRISADMNLLMSIAVFGAMMIGEWFEAAAVAFLFSFSLLLESWSVGRARRAIEALLDLSPTVARYISSHGGDILERPVGEVPIGATILVRPGEKIPLDGTITKGQTSVNQAPITGESMPVSKSIGDNVFAGTINEDGAIEFTSTKSASDTTLSRIIHMVEDAQSRRAPSEQWVEKFARIYTPSMIILAALIAVIPPLFFGGAWGQWFYQALVILVISCPCALVISTPVSIVAALACSARAGVLIKGGAFLETAGRLKAIAMDKTGTITYGRPEVQELVPFNGYTEEELLKCAAAMESNSDHPLARAVIRRAEAAGIKIEKAENFRAIKGKGAEATINDQSFWLGSHRLLHEKGNETQEIHDRAESMEDAGHSVVAIGNDQHVCGLISIADTIREQSPDVIKALRNAGVESIVMLTGDNKGTANAVASVVGIDEVQSELLPEEKMRSVELLVKHYQQVAMVGDGINDAPALAAASLGVAMGAVGTDAAIETADIALMSDDLMKLPWLIRHAQHTLNVIHQNIGFALAVKFIFMALALADMATLWMAIAADMGASLVVIVNGLRLLKGKSINDFV